MTKTKTMMCIILSVFFVLLLTYQTFLAHFKEPIIEGNTDYKDYDPNNVMILAQQNAGNISALKTQMDSVTDLSGIVEDISGNVANIQSQLDGLAQAQQQSAEDLVGTSPPDISGTS